MTTPAPKAVTTALPLIDPALWPVLLGTAVIAVTAAALGSLLYLRRQALLADVTAHAALPGTLLGFMLAASFPALAPLAFPLQLGAGTISGVLAALTAGYLANLPRVRVDAALAVTLTLWFGAGMLLLRVISDGDYPGKGGAQGFLLGNATSITHADLGWLCAAAAITFGALAACWRPFSLLVFDATHARTVLPRATLLEALLRAVCAVSLVLGVKVVGVVLMVAFAVLPAAAARQWVRHLPAFVLLAAVIGATSSIAGVWLSLATDWPTGPSITLALTGMFVVSLCFAPRRGIVFKASGVRA